MIEARELTRRYDRLLAVDHVSFEARQGEIVGLLGPNGAGKTTVMKILTGYHFPQGGSAAIAGYDVVAETVAAQRHVGYLPENAPLYDDLTVTEYLEFIAAARQLPRPAVGAAIERVAARCGVTAVLERLMRELSRGYRQRVGLSQALIHDPDVVILDEPTSGLDPNQIQEVRRVIRELGAEKTVLLSTHILREVEVLCDRVLILDHGRIVAEGRPEEIARELHGRTVVEFVVAGTLAPEALRALELAGDVVSHRDEAGEAKVRLALHEGKEGEDVFDWAASHGVRIRSLVPERVSLEEIFERLTGGSEE